MNTIVALPLAAAVPTTAPAMPLDPADELLVAAANGLFSADDAIQQMHRAHTAAGGKTMSMSERITRPWLMLATTTLPR